MFNIEEIRARHEADKKTIVWGSDYGDTLAFAARIDRATLLRALDAMAEENAELTAVFVAQSGAYMRAKQRWQIATGKEGTWPDRADLVVWLLERVEKLEAALDEAKWQPIETAPRDGTMFLGFIDNKGEDFNEMLVMFCKRDSEPFWTTHSDDHIGMNPTHWMPLPAPPATKETK